MAPVGGFDLGPPQVVGTKRTLPTPWSPVFHICRTDIINPLMGLLFKSEQRGTRALSSVLNTAGSQKQGIFSFLPLIGVTHYEHSPKLNITFPNPEIESLNSMQIVPDA